MTNELKNHLKLIKDKKENIIKKKKDEAMLKLSKKLKIIICYN